MEYVINILDASFYNSTGFYLVVLGVLVSIRFSGFPDLTVDGSYTLGAAFYSYFQAMGIGTIPSILITVFVGVLAGSCTAILNHKIKMGKIISSVIVMLLAILLIPYVTGGSSVSLLRTESFFSWISQLDKEITYSLFEDATNSFHLLFNITIILSIVLISYLLWKFSSKHSLGVKLRYLGSAENPGLVKRKNRFPILLLGLAMGNGLVALGGAIEAERKGGFNQNMGQGVILISLAMLILGESILKSQKKRDFLTTKEYISAAFIGCIVYSFGIQLLITNNLMFLDLRITSTLFLLILLGYASKKYPNSSQLF